MTALSRRNRAIASEGRWLLVPVLIAVVGGVVGAGNVRVGIAVAGVSAIVALGFACSTLKGAQALAILLVASTFVTRFKFSVAGAHFRPEDILALVALIALAATTRVSLSTRRVASTIRHPTIYLLFAYVVWSVVSSLLESPHFTASLRICGWLGLDWVILVVVVAAFPVEGDVERVGMRFGMLAFIAADVLYVIGTHIGFGVQLAQSTLSGTKSAYGLSYEANILGSTAAIWLFLAVTSYGLPGLGRFSWRQPRTYLIAAGLMALIVSYTRAAVLGLVAGLLIWALLEGYRARQILVRRLGIFVLVAALVLVAVPSVGKPVFTKLNKATSLSSSTGVTRVDSSETALQDLRNFHWIVGLGLNSYGQRHLDLTRPDEEVAGYLSVLPLEIVYDGGAVGAIILLLAFVSARPWKTRYAGRLVGLCVVYLVSSLATSPFWLGSSWILIALAVLGDMNRATLAPVDRGAGDAFAPSPSS